MGHLTGKTAIITGGGRAVLTDGTCGSVWYRHSIRKGRRKPRTYRQKYAKADRR